jgi:hypothetical protein
LQIRERQPPDNECLDGAHLERTKEQRIVSSIASGDDFDALPERDISGDLGCCRALNA